MLLGPREPVPPIVEAREDADLQALEHFQYIYTSEAPGTQPLLISAGCSCLRCCNRSDVGDTPTATCSCLFECDKGLQALKERGRAAGVVVLLECGPACHCSNNISRCTARPTQQGVSVKLAVYWSQQKGWCVRTLDSISQGQFVCEYAGQYVSGDEADRRLSEYDQEERGHALLIVRLQLPSQTSSIKCCIDATRTGNIASFINHSCDGGNLEPVIVSAKGTLLPRVALFAARTIEAGEELSFMYAAVGSSNGGADTDSSSSSRRCHCGASVCSGFLPRAH